MKPNTERDYHRRIARVAEAILSDPGAPHTVDSLAAVASLSPYHFHRVYRAFTGERIAASVRRIRLARGAAELAGGDDSVTAVALNVGYESPQTFARAFREFTGLSPGQFKRRQQLLATPAVDEAAISRRGSQDEALQAHAGVDLTELAPIDALCLRHHGPLGTIGHSFRKLLWMMASSYAPEKACDLIGIAFGDPEEEGSFAYFAGVITTAPERAPQGLTAVRVEGGLYAEHRLIGPHALIAPTFRTLYGGWLPRSGFVPDDRPALEIYRNPSSRPASERPVTELLIPIRAD